MKVSEAIDRIKVGDTVWAKCGVGEIDTNNSYPLKVCSTSSKNYWTWVSINDEISLTEPVSKKQEVPECVGKWIKFCQSRRVSLHTAMNECHDICAEIQPDYKNMRDWLTNENYQEHEEIFARAWLDGFTVETKRWVVKEGDLVIRKGKHEAKIYFVEAVDGGDILLVNGIQDEYYSDEDCNLDSFYEEFRLLAKKENLESEVEGSVEEV